MERAERKRGRPYATVVRLRSDLRLPSGLELAPAWAPELRGAGAARALVMRGVWLFWGARDAVGAAILGYVEALPALHRAGQRAYLPLPYAHLVRVGAAGLGAGMLGWLKFPKQTAAKPHLFPGGCVGSTECVVRHSRQHLEALEALNAAVAAGATTLRPEQLVSVRDGWWRWDGIPDNEKYFLYHVLNASLVPRSFLDLYNRHAPSSKQVSFLGRSNGLLLPE